MKEYIKKEILPIVLIIVIVGGINLIVMLYVGRSSIPQYKQIEIKDRIIDLKFDKELDDKLVYKDALDNKYIIKDNRIISYIKNIDNFGLNNYKNELDIKSDEIEELLNINLKDYKLRKENNEYFYQKYINDIKTSDGIYIKTNKEGLITHIRTNKIGVFDNLVSDITKDKIICINEKDKYKIKDILIDYNNSNYVVECLVEGENIDPVEIVYNL